MTKKEFIQEMNDIGLNIKLVHAYLDERRGSIGSCGIYQDGND